MPNKNPIAKSNTINPHQFHIDKIKMLEEVNQEI